jgi:tetraacyldisaccharide 4'-kinase
MKLRLTPLWLLSLLYGVIVMGRYASYAWGLCRRRRLPCRVISVGNLTVGGTGKTPLTIWLARWYRRQGWRVVVLSRGYGAHRERPVQVVSTGAGPLIDWRAAGDEPYMLAQALPGIPVLIALDRYLGGRYACEHFRAQVLILDDGFQHYALHRDLDVVLIDASNPFGAGALLPRGMLREPLRALQRADVVVLTRVDMATETLSALYKHIRRWHARPPISSVTVAEALSQWGHDRLETPTQLAGQRVVAFAGIGNPSALVATLEQLGAEVVACLVYPDHHPYTLDDWQAILEVAQQQRAAYLVTTDKDAVRMATDWDAPLPLYTVRVGITFVQGHESFTQQLATLMAGIPTHA